MTAILSMWSGTLDPYETGTGFSIRPVVGIIPPGLPLMPHEREVAEVFHVPFAHVARHCQS